MRIGKVRSLAAEAAKCVHISDEISIQKEQQTFVLLVIGLADKRPDKRDRRNIIRFKSS